MHTLHAWPFNKTLLSILTDTKYYFYHQLQYLYGRKCTEWRKLHFMENFISNTFGTRVFYNIGQNGPKKWSNIGQIMVKYERSIRVQLSCVHKDNERNPKTRSKHRGKLIKKKFIFFKWLYILHQSSGVSIKKFPLRNINKKILNLPPFTWENDTVPEISFNISQEWNIRLCPTSAIIPVEEQCWRGHADADVRSTHVSSNKCLSWLFIGNEARTVSESVLVFSSGRKQHSQRSLILARIQYQHWPTRRQDRRRLISSKEQFARSLESEKNPTNQTTLSRSMSIDIIGIK